MRAAVVGAYGPPEVVEVRTVETPRLRDGDVLVRVRAASVNSGDARIRGASFPPGFGAPARLALGLRGPRRGVLGVALAGVVEQGPADGPAVGTRVAAMTGARMGAHAELAAVPGSRCVPIPDTVSDADAAAMLFGGTTALHYLRDKADVGGRSVLVVGASGAVGVAAVQLARHLGAAAVTGVCSSRNEALVRDLGADRVIAYDRTPLAEVRDPHDVVLDCVGGLSLRTAEPFLAPDGRLLLAVASLGQTVLARGRVGAGPAPERASDIEVLLGLVADGTLRTPIDATYGLDDIVAAHRLVDSGRKVGAVLVAPAVTG